MSQENVELVRRVFATAAEHETPAARAAAARAFLHPEAEWYPQREDPDSTPRKGLDEILDYLEQWFEAWDEFRMEPESLIDAGDKVVACAHETGRGRGSGAEWGRESFYVITVRDGLILRAEGFYDRHEALEAAGLSEG
jgi:ketosteroid isomerase-like protein